MEKSLDFVEQWAEENNYVIVSSDMWAIAQDIMSKYQKIQEIIDNWTKPEEIEWAIREVLEDDKI